MKVTLLVILTFCFLLSDMWIIPYMMSSRWWARQIGQCWMMRGAV